MTRPDHIRQQWQPYYALLGELVSVWDKVELGCTLLFQESFSADPRTTHALFHSARSLDLKLDLLRNALPSLTVEEGFKQELRGVLEKVEKLSRRRNNIIHGNWIITNYLGDDPNNFGPPLRVANMPDMDLRQKLVEAAVSGRGAHVLQKDMDRHVYTIARLEQVIVDIDRLAETIFGLFRRLRAQKDAAAGSD